MAFADLPLSHELGGRRSQYTDKLPSLATHRFPTPQPGSTVTPNVTLYKVKTPGSPFYIGTAVDVTIYATVEAVAHVIRDVQYYKQLFPGFAKVNLTEEKDNCFTVYWERPAPIFLLPNVFYSTKYVGVVESPERRMFRYQLKSSNRLTASDGISFIDALQPKVTRFRAYDFYNADWGPAVTLAPKRIWNDALKGQYEAMLLIKLRAEYPTMRFQSLQDRAAKISSALDPQAVPALDVFAEVKTSASQ